MVSSNDSCEDYRHFRGIPSNHHLNQAISNVLERGAA